MMNEQARRWSRKCWALCFLLGTPWVKAQPPLEVEWMSEITTPNNILSGLVDPSTGQVHLVLDDQDGSIIGCSGDEIVQVYGSNGLPIIPWTDPCLSQGSLDHWVASAMRTTLGPADVLVVSSVGNPNHSHIFLNGAGEIQSWNQGPPNYGYAYASTVFADDDTLYVGGWDIDCSEPGRVYKRGGTYWRACTPEIIDSFEALSDSILAIHFPRVYVMDKTTGTLGSTFDLFTGPASNSGKSCLDGDTLYWTSVVSGNTRVGKYVVGQGPAWEQTLPFSGAPKGLELDPHGRLWTAVGNNLIWVDASDGSYSSVTQGSSIRTLEMQLGSLLFTGRLSPSVAFITKAVPTP